MIGAEQTGYSEDYAVKQTLVMRELFGGIIEQVIDSTSLEDYAQAEETARRIDVHSIPTGKAYIKLHPFTFLYDEIPDPDSRDTEDYERKVHNIAHGTGRMLFIHVDELLRSKDFDPDAWRQYESYFEDLAFEKHKASEVTHVANFREFRDDNIHDVAHARQYARTILYAFNARLSGQGYIAGHTAVPVGGYGEGFAQSLLQATLTVQTAFNVDKLDSFLQLTSESHLEDIKHHLARYYIDKPDSVYDAAIATFYEGLVTVVGAIAMLTSRKVVGYNDPYILTKDIVSRGIVERYARITPPGLIGPMTLLGAGYKEPLVRDPNGELELNPELYSQLKKARSVYATKPQTRTHFLKKMCPVSDENGGIRQMASVITRLMG